MSKKVLIVEDYEDSRSFMKFLVESYGYQVVEGPVGYHHACAGWLRGNCS